MILLSNLFLIFVSLICVTAIALAVYAYWEMFKAGLR